MTSNVAGNRRGMARTFKVWTPKDTAAIEEMRAKGLSYQVIADRMGRTADAVKRHHRRKAPFVHVKVTAPITQYRYTDRGEPIGGRDMLPQDDADYIAACIAGGGFTRENFWGLR